MMNWENDEFLKTKEIRHTRCTEKRSDFLFLRRRDLLEKEQTKTGISILLDLCKSLFYNQNQSKQGTLEGAD